MTLTEMHLAEGEMAGPFSSPQVLVPLLRACLEGRDPQLLAEIILQDAVLSARLIQAAQKTAPNRVIASEPISSALQAVGLPVLGGLVLQAARQLIGADFSTAELRFLSQLWSLSRVAGQSAQCIAPTVNYPHVEEAQLSGSLLPLGNHLLFARHRLDYIELVSNPLSSASLRRHEDENFGTDHLRLLEEVVAGWQFDSFLVDAVRFLHVAAQQIEHSSPLLKITRLAFQFSREPRKLNEETIALAQRLFSFRGSEMTYLFDWAQGLYQADQPDLDDPEKLQREFSAQLSALSELVFSLADQEGVRARLSGSHSLEELVSSARNLYLEASAAPEAIFLLADHRGKQLVGVAASEQARLINELTVPLNGSGGLAAQALLKGEPLHSLQAQLPLAISDQMLQRLCCSREFFAQPFRLAERLLGVFVLGFTTEPELAQLQTLRVQMISRVVSESLAKFSSNGTDIFGEGASLLRRVSHEVSNPLTIIGNYAEVLHHVLADTDNRELADSIKKEVRRIDGILNYYLNQQEMPAFPGSVVCLNEMIHEVLEALAPSELEPRNIKLELMLQENLTKVATNPLLVKQILVNLVKNAAEAIGSGGRISFLSRDIYCSDGKRYIEIDIQDDGPGIDPLVQKKLFRPIVSTKGPGHAGVGLSIVKSMTDDLGGQISCQNVAGAGAGFCLRVPAGEVGPDTN